MVDEVQKCRNGVLIPDPVACGRRGLKLINRIAVMSIYQIVINWTDTDKENQRVSAISSSGDEGC